MLSGRFAACLVTLLVISSSACVQSALSNGRTPGSASTFSDGSASQDIFLESRPETNRSAGVILPWNADVTSASVTISGTGRPGGASVSRTASEMLQGTTENITAEGSALRLREASFGWEQSASDIGLNCTAVDTLTVNGLTLNHSNPVFSAAGSGIWRHRAPLTVTEQGGIARTSEVVTAQVTFTPGTVRDPSKEIRVADAQLAEVPSFVYNASFQNSWCTGASINFVAASVAASGSATYYIYYGNPSAAKPSYEQQVYIAESFNGASLGPSWTATNLDGLTYGTGGTLRVQGTASSEFWKGVSFDHSYELPSSFNVTARINLASGTGSGYVVGVSVFQDAQNAINMGWQYDAGIPQLSPEKYMLSKTDAGAFSLAGTASAGAQGTTHIYKGSYSSGIFNFSVDATPVCSTALSMQYPKLRLSAAARAIGDTMDVTFDSVLVHSGHSSVSLGDPPLWAAAGAPENVGYRAQGTLTSPHIQNDDGIPYGQIALEGNFPAGTTSTVSVLSENDQVLQSGLIGGAPLNISSTDHRTIKLRIALTSDDPGISPRISSWGIGNIWRGLASGAGAFSPARNITLEQGAVALARTPDRWLKGPSPALNTGTASTFDDMGVSHPWVLRTESGYRMYYAGYDGMRWRIGLALSSDGVNWTRYPNNPVLVPGTGWESSFIDWPCVVYNGSGYMMWYAGSSDNGISFRIGCAFSSDGFRWTRYPSNPVISVGAGGSWSANSVFAPRVLFNEDGYKMWFGGKNATVNSTGYAASLDGISWSASPSNPVLSPVAASWCSLGVVPGGVSHSPLKGYTMWYGGFNSSIQGVGLAESQDGVSWARTVNGPVLAGSGGSGHDSAAATNASVLWDGVYRIWYSASDGARWRIGSGQADFFRNGTVLSSPVELGVAPANSTIRFTRSTPTNTSVEIYVRSSADNTSYGPWTNVSASPHNARLDRYVQFMVILRSTRNDTSPVLTTLDAGYEYFVSPGAVTVYPASLPTYQNLTSVTVTPVSSGGGSLRLQGSGDNGSTWTDVAPFLQENLSGGALAVRVILEGDFTTSPALSALGCDFTYVAHASDPVLDIGGEGTADWNQAGIFTTQSVVSIAAGLNTYLDTHRNDTGDNRVIPLVLSSSTPGRISLTLLRIDYTDKPMQNQPPIITSTPVERATPGVSYAYDVDAQDTDRRDRVSYSLASAPAGMGITELTGEIFWTPTVEQIGYHPVSVNITDGHVTVRQDFTIIVSTSPTNRPPRVTSAPSLTGNVGITYAYTVTATDADLDPIEITIGHGSPPGARIETGGKLSWVPTANQTGAQRIVIVLADGKESVQHAFTVAVSSAGANSLPAVTSTPPASARVNLTYTHPFRAADADGDTVSFGILSGPAAATIASDGSFQYVPANADRGNVTVVLKVSDGKGYSLFTFTIQVNQENRAPRITNSPAVINIKMGNTWTHASTSSDDDRDTVTYGLVSSPPGMTINNVTGLIIWKPGSSQTGNFRFTVFATDSIATSVQNITLTVAAPPAQKGFFEQYGLYLIILTGMVAAIGGVAALRRKKTPAKKTETPVTVPVAPRTEIKEMPTIETYETDKKPTEVPAATDEKSAQKPQEKPAEPGALTKPAIKAVPRIVSKNAPAMVAAPPPPEPPKEVTPEPMKQVGQKAPERAPPASAAPVEGVIAAAPSPPSAPPEKPVEKPVLRCGSCGADTEPGWAMCPVCGERLLMPPPPPPELVGLVPPPEETPAAPGSVPPDEKSAAQRIEEATRSATIFEGLSLDKILGEPAQIPAAEPGKKKDELGDIENYLTEGSGDNKTETGALKEDMDFLKTYLGDERIRTPPPSTEHADDWDKMKEFVSNIGEQKKSDAPAPPVPAGPEGPSLDDLIKSDTLAPPPDSDPLKGLVPDQPGTPPPGDDAKTIETPAAPEDTGARPPSGPATPPQAPDTPPPLVPVPDAERKSDDNKQEQKKQTVKSILDDLLQG